MHREVLLGWLAGLFAVMASVLVLAAVVVGWPVLLVALPLAGMAWLFWYHASGRLTERMRARTSRRPRGAGRTAATGPRGGRPPPGTGRGGAGRDGVGRGRAGRGGTGREGDRRRQPPPGAEPSTGMSRERARAILGLARDPEPTAVRAAYRRKVKEVHPDRGGDEEAFKRVIEAYEALGGGS